MKKLFLALIVLIFIFGTVLTSCRSKKIPCPAYKSSAEVEQTVKNV